jgi:hypothetical protein
VERGAGLVSIHQLLRTKESVMKKSLFTPLMIAVVFFLSTSGYCAELAPAIEKKASGIINWTLGIVQTAGTGKALKNDSTTTFDVEIKAFLRAKSDAQGRLLDVVKEIRINSNMQVGSFANKSDVVMAKIKEMVFKAQEIEKLRKHRSDGSVEVCVQLNLFGGFAQLVLPDEIQQIESIKHILPTKNPPSSGLAKTAASDIYTGLVVDARGIAAKPAMVPRLLDENGQEVYGTAFASREFAVQRGMCLYAADFKPSQKDSRVGPRPLIVKGIKTLGPGQSNIVVSNADASKLLSSSEHLLFLKECKVVIVLDPQLN